MINLIGLKNVVKPAKTQYNSINSFRYANIDQKPDTFERSDFAASPISFTGKSNRLKEYKKLTEDLNKTAQTAQDSLDKQLATEGWSGKTADAISILWNSKNRAVLVQADIDTYKNQVTELDASIKTDSFKDKFKEMFEVDYNPSNIVRYNKKSQQLETALTSSCIAKYTEEKLSKNIDIYNKNSGKLQDYTETRINPYAQTGSIPTYNHTTTKDEIFEKMENSLVEILGDKKVLDIILSSNGLDCEKASKEDKYKMYGYLSSFIVESSKATAQKSLKGQTLAQIKADSDKSYEKAFGTKNDIIKRVDKYNSSQKTGAACVEFVANVVLNTLGPGSVFGSCLYSAGKSIAFDIADTKTKTVDRDLDIKSIVVNAGLSGASGIVNRIIVIKYASDVATKILGGKTSFDNFGSKLVKFVVDEIISKEGVKLPAYGVEEIVKAVVKNMVGLKKEKDTGFSQKDLENSMVIVAKAMTYLTSEKSSGKLDNKSQKEIVAQLNNHISTSMKNNNEFSTWLNKNNSSLQELLNQLVKIEFS